MACPEARSIFACSCPQDYLASLLLERLACMAFAVRAVIPQAKVIKVLDTRMFLREKSNADFPVFLHLVFQTSHRATIQQSYISRQKQIKNSWIQNPSVLEKGSQRSVDCSLTRRSNMHDVFRLSIKPTRFNLLRRRHPRTWRLAAQCPAPLLRPKSTFVYGGCRYAIFIFRHQKYGIIIE